ncbi:hypothetical protein CLV35_3720 [Motilibacter peucedani]|uniref:Uncharacterized protein n=1 Tax=Motilibacter peucedani TaxID=598650 RepID=A0A420XKC5_9ACTN|nr:hypothetical protein [Motilibacter peucedani]RKS68591.1 hypothetical protein CLV35_3720 [Motilibacter peucedani]
MDGSRLTFGLVLFAIGAVVLAVDLARLRQRSPAERDADPRGQRTVLRRIATPLLAVGLGWVVVALL